MFYLIPNQDAIAHKTLKRGSDEATEIVVLSDTVRQRRARTPSSSNESNEKPMPSTVIEQNSQKTTLPDVLPTTFRLAEASALFDEISKNGELQPNQTDSEHDDLSTHVSMVAVRERNASLMSVRNSGITKMNESVNTISILESVDSFVPEYVETVTIYDMSDTSDTDTDDKKQYPSSERLVSELETVEDDENSDIDEVALRETSDSNEKIIIEKRRISFDNKCGHLEAERDLLKDSELPTFTPRSSLRPTLREILSGEDRDSFYNSDKDNFEDPLVFSDDEDIPRFPVEFDNDYDMDLDMVF